MPKWVSSTNFVEDENVSISDYQLYPSDITPDETKFGFIQAVIPHPTAHYYANPTHCHIVLAELGSSLIAVKLLSPDLSVIRYAIWNEDTFVSISESALNIAELKNRFPRKA